MRKFSRRMFPHSGTFQKYEATRNEGGGYDEATWIDVFTTKCHVQPVSSNEYIQAQQLQAPIDHDVYYPYQEGITASMRFIWHDRADKVIDLKSTPLDQGGMGRIMQVKGELKDGS